MGNKLISIKVGTHVITSSDGLPDEGVISDICSQISSVKKNGHQVVLISSGAVAAGRGIFKSPKITDTVEQRQLLSSLGQVELMLRYKKAFDKLDILCLLSAAASMLCI